MSYCRLGWLRRIIKIASKLTKTIIVLWWCLKMTLKICICRTIEGVCTTIFTLLFSSSFVANKYNNSDYNCSYNTNDRCYNVYCIKDWSVLCICCKCWTSISWWSFMDWGYTNKNNSILTHSSQPMICFLPFWLYFLELSEYRNYCHQVTPFSFSVIDFWYRKNNWYNVV